MTAFMWAFLTACVWGFVPLIEKIGLSRTTPLPAIFLRSMGVAIGIIFLSLFRFDAVRQAATVRPINIVCIMLGGILASVVGQFCFYHALKTGELSKVVPVAAAYPLISFVLGLLILRESLTMAKIAGVVLVLLGVVLLK